MLALYVPALVVAFLITLLEMTEVVALVFALSADRSSVRPAALGAVGGAVLVAAIALGFGAILVAFPRSYLLWVSAAVLAAFGGFLYRETVRAYRRSRLPASAAAPAGSAGHRVAQFGGGFSVGAVETTEAVIVLLALAAAGYGLSALVGALVGAAVLVVAAALVHDRIRRIKVPWLRLGGTSLLFSFAIFWAGEAAGVAWPGGDLVLVPLVVAVALVVRGAIALVLRSPAPVATA